VLAPTRARAADLVGLVAFHGPAGAARDTTQARARDAGLAWIDLSPAPPPPLTAAASVRAGIDAYDELRWDDALAALDAAIAEVWRTGGADLGGAELSDVFLYRGLVSTQRGDTATAWDDLVRAAALSPARTLDPLRFPTRAVEAFDRARAAVAKLARARVTVDAPGCDAAIDGGAAASAEVPLGEHVVRVACPDRAPWGQRVVVAGDLTVTPPADDAGAPPDDAALAALAAAHGAVAVLAVIVTADLAAVRVVDARGEVTAVASVRLGEGDLAAAIDRVLAPPEVVVVRPAQRPWWRSPWLWAGVGAAVTAAVLIPFAVSTDDSHDTIPLRPLGWSW